MFLIFVQYFLNIYTDNKNKINGNETAWVCSQCFITFLCVDCIEDYKHANKYNYKYDEQHKFECYPIHRADFLDIHDIKHDIE